MHQPPRYFQQTTFEAHPRSIGMVRDLVASVPTEHLPTHLVGDLVLVADELATNALTHAGTAFTVSVERVEATVLLTVTDGSSRLPQQRASSDDMPLGGRGLAIVAVLSRHWGVDAQPSGAKSVWAAFDARERDDARA